MFSAPIKIYLLLTLSFLQKKYLEKYLTIRHLLGGSSSLGVRASDGFTEDVKSLFDQLQGPFDELVRKGENLRYSFLNYNFVFRRIFDLLGCSHYGADFVSFYFSSLLSFSLLR